METKKHPRLGNIVVNDFRQIWNKYIMPLAPQKKVLYNTQGGSYIIREVNDNSITFSPDSDENEKKTVYFSKCQMAYEALLQKNGYISRTEILSIIKVRRSSFIVSLLDTLPHVEATSNPRGLKLI